MLANEKSKGMGDQEEGMDLADEVDMGGKVRTLQTTSLPRFVHCFLLLFKNGLDAPGRPCIGRLLRKAQHCRKNSSAFHACYLVARSVVL